MSLTDENMHYLELLTPGTESPRLLVAWGRKDAAAAALNKLRVRTSTSEQTNAIEVEAIEQAILEAKRLSSQGGWIEWVLGAPHFHDVPNAVSVLF